MDYIKPDKFRSISHYHEHGAQENDCETTLIESSGASTLPWESQMHMPRPADKKTCLVLKIQTLARKTSKLH